MDGADATMYGLAMSAVSAQLVALTVPLLLCLLASMWILAQEKERHGPEVNTGSRNYRLRSSTGSIVVFVPLIRPGSHDVPFHIFSPVDLAEHCVHRVTLGRSVCEIFVPGRHDIEDESDFL
ncbi:hypothetical protein EDD18DRAFT_378554 [Armillaria luteobubalina]|uniref:Uncharacterized protein n=1 Tax=Armillaria luteobubalina TaxID=153913 RepID=A0AA39Q364_9AGAR|nr:hypothetical protein EDD18DRAFT_378554 [Armillaria luteobubalina]